MAECLKDAEDRALEAMFRSDPLPDDGFSRHVTRRIRRRLWLRRLLVPAAVLAGGLVAVGPASTLLAMAMGTVFSTGTSLLPASAPSLVPALLPGFMLLAGLIAALRLVED